MIAENMIAKMQAVKALLSGARKVVVLTGAGVSAESGVPTFRGEDGMWKSHSVDDLARPEAFSRDPVLVWAFYNWRRSLVARCEPNEAHKALVRLGEMVPDFTLVTQNVDGLHQKAGSRDVAEMHGSLWRVHCTKCSHDEYNYDELPNLPECPVCGHMMRPGVVWFGEQLAPGLISSVLNVISRADIMLVVGTSSLVQPAASLAHIAKRVGAVTVEINLEPTQNTGFMDFSMLGEAGSILPELVEGIPAQK